MFLVLLRNELWKLFGKKRTYIGFGFLLAVQLLIVLILYYNESAQRHLRLTGGKQAFSSMSCAAAMLLPQAFLLLPLYVALVGGDLVAKEAEEGTLRMVLSRPVSRVRLLFAKWLAGVIFGAALVCVLGVGAFLISSLWFPWGDLIVFIPDEGFGLFDAGAGLRHYLLAHLLMTTKAATLTSLAFMFSCFNVRPAAATVLTISVAFADRVLSEMPYFVELKHLFLASHLNCWALAFGDPVPWWRILASLCLLLGFNVTFITIGIAAFQVRDIKS
jgi:ABC-2 type transport system permease protein